MKARSPRAPRVTLKDGLVATEKLFSEARRAEVSRETAAKQMGYSGKSGPSLTLLASLLEYGLLEKRGLNVKVSELAVQIIHPVSEAQKLEALRRAASRPKLFAELLKSHAECGLSVLTANLIHRDFTPESAKKTAMVFRENLEFAKLNQWNYSPSPENASNDEDDDFDDEPEEASATTASPAPVNAPPPPVRPFAGTQQTRQPMTALPSDSFLPIPLDIGDALIPRGMSNDDFDLLLESLKLWKRKIVRAEQSPPPGKNDEFEV